VTENCSTPFAQIASRTGPHYWGVPDAFRAQRISLTFQHDWHGSARRRPGRHI